MVKDLETNLKEARDEISTRNETVKHLEEKVSSFKKPNQPSGTKYSLSTQCNKYGVDDINKSQLKRKCHYYKRTGFCKF